MHDIQRNLNALMILILMGVLLGAFGVQIILHEEPCPLCLLQRVAMLGVSLGALLNIFYNIRMSHYALILVSSLFGGTVALRQISLHVCPGMPAYGSPVLGLSLYTWSFFIFTCCVAGVALLLALYNSKAELSERPPLNGFQKLAMLLFFLVAFANIINSFWICGLGPCAE